MNPYFSNIDSQFLQLNLLETGEEIVSRSTEGFPVCAYICDFQKVIGGLYPYHWHNELQLTIADENPLLIMMNGDRLELLPGEGVFINTRVLHSIYVLKELPCKRKDIIFDASALYGSRSSVFYTDYLGKLMNCRSLPYVHFNIHDGKEELRLFSSAFEDLRNQPYGFEYKVRGSLTNLFFNICKKYTETIDNPDIRYGQRENRVRIMLRFICEHYSEEISAKEIAESANISERECYRCFQDVLKKTPAGFLQEHRLTIAEHLLLNTEKSIAEISELCGIRSASYFSKMFRETLHCTPGEYRKRAGHINQILI